MAAPIPRFGPDIPPEADAMALRILTAKAKLRRTEDLDERARLRAIIGECSASIRRLQMAAGTDDDDTPE